MTYPVWISLGSNIEPKRHLRLAVQCLAKKLKSMRTSTIYETSPVGFKNQIDFWNMAVTGETGMGPRLIRTWLRGIEDELGRIRTDNKFGPRVIDLDIAAYARVQLREGPLVILDPDISTSAFILFPLAELSPEIVLPGLQSPLGELRDSFNRPNQRIQALPAFDWAPRDY